MNKNQIQSKPQDVEEPSEEGLDETLCSASSELDEVNERMTAYRKKHFAVEVGPSRWGCGDEINVSITSNGYQWQSISLMPDEIERVMDALKPFLPNAIGEARANNAAPNQNQTF